MIQNKGDIVRRVGALLDDPANTRYTDDYLTPHIDQCFDEMDVDLEVLGLEYVEHIAIVDVAPDTSDLMYLLADGQELSTMKLVSKIRWKLQGQPDTSYSTSAYVDELDEVGPDSQGALEWTQQQGSVQITPSSSALTLKIYFDAMSTDIYDDAQKVIRGTAHILALRVAAYVASLQNGMGTLQKKLDQKSDVAWTKFCKLVVKNDQKKMRVPRPMHPRRFPMNMPSTPAS